MPDFKVDTTMMRANASRASMIKRMVNTQSYEVSRISSRMIGFSLLPVRIYLQMTASELRREGRRLTNLSTSMRNTVTLYLTAENHIKEFSGSLQNPAFTGTEYGGSQASPRKHWREVEEIVRKYHPEWTERQIKKYLTQLNEEGCGYIAMINTIFLKYKGREDEFEKTFGFPMYKENGELNYDALVTDFYTAKDDPNHQGTRSNSRERMWEEYCREHGIAVDVKDVNVTADNYKELVKKGQIVVGLSPVILYDESGKKVFDSNGGHAMTVTGVTEDGRLIVSSWGETYYLDRDLSIYNDHCDFQQVIYE